MNGDMVKVYIKRPNHTKKECHEFKRFGSVLWRDRWRSCYVLPEQYGTSDPVAFIKQDGKMEQVGSVNYLKGRSHWSVN